MRFNAFRQPGADTAAPFEASVGWGPTGWRPLPVPAPWEQRGVYGDSFLNQVPGAYPGLQLRNGRSELYPGWMGAAIPSFWQTAHSGNSAGGLQRTGGKPGDPAAAGPIASRRMRRRVLQGQLAQSGAAALGFQQQMQAWGGS